MICTPRLVIAKESLTAPNCGCTDRFVDAKVCSIPLDARVADMALPNVIVLVVRGVAELDSVCRGCARCAVRGPEFASTGRRAPTNRLGRALKLLRDNHVIAVMVWRCGPSILAAPRAGLVGGSARLPKLCLTLTIGRVSGRRAGSQT